MKPVTKMLHTRVQQPAFPSVTPLFQNSAFEAESPFFYTRRNNPNVEEFENAVKELEGARHGVAFSTGMAAIRACFDVLRPGDTIVINRLIYGCSYRLVHNLAAWVGVDLQVLDLSSQSSAANIPPSTSLVFFETPTNPFLKAVDISYVSRIVKERNPNALVVVDNTWATSLFQKPLTLGADISVHSATKYISGHSDVMGGVILTDNDEINDRMRNTRFYSGAILEPHAAWLLRRSLQTLAVRVQAQSSTTYHLSNFLSTLPQVANVYYPEVDGRQLCGYAGIIFIQLQKALIRKYAEVASALRLFGTGTAMACVTSMIAQPYFGSHASMTPEEKQAIGLDPGLIRLCFGLEDPEDLKQDLVAALERVMPAGMT